MPYTFVHCKFQPDIKQESERCLPIDGMQFILVFVIVLMGAVLQGSLGFGLGPLAVPLLLLIDPGFIPGPMLLVSIFLTFSVFRRERSDFHKEGFGWVILGRIIGSAAGTGLLLIIPNEDLNLLYGSLIILAVILSVSGWKLSMLPRNFLFAGSLSGMMATAAAIGGPSMALVYQHGSGPRLRSTLSAIFLMGSFIALIFLFIAGKLGIPEFIRALILLPGIVTGFYLSKFSKTVLDKKLLRPAILTVSFFAAVVLVINNL